MNSNKSILLLLCLVVFFGCKTGNSDKKLATPQTDAKIDISGSFSISGAYALYPLVSKWADDFMKIHPAVKIEVTKAGTGQGIEDLISAKTHLAMISRPLTDDEINAGLWSVPVAKDGVAPIVNQRNPYIESIMSQGLSPDEYLKVFTGDQQLTWGELLDIQGKEKVVVYARSDESGAADIFANFIFKESSSLKGIKVRGDDEMIKSIQDNILGIGFCNFSYAFDVATGERMKDIQIIPSDLDFDNKIERKEMPFNNIEEAHRALWLGVFPKSLCRELTISSLGKPSDQAIVEFLRYVLTDGQENVAKTGLCELNNVYIRYSLEKLN